MALVFHVSADTAIQDEVHACTVNVRGAERTTAEFKYGVAGVSHGTLAGNYSIDGVLDWPVWSGGVQAVGDAVRDTDFTMELWFKFATSLSPSPQNIVYFGHENTGSGVSGAYSIRQTLVDATTRSVKLYDENATVGSTPVNITSGTWNHIAAVFNRSDGNVIFAVNGVIVDDACPTGSLTYAGIANSITFTVDGSDGFTDDFGISSTAKYVGTTGATYTMPTALLSNGSVMNAAITAPAPVFSSQATNMATTIDLTSPSPTLVAGSLPAVATVALSAPSPSLYTTTGGNTTLTPPKPLLYAQGHDSYGEQAAFLTAPSPTLAITTGANSKLTAPSPTLSTSATGTIWGAADLSAPSATLVAAGTVTELASASLTAPSPNLIGYGGAVCSITLTGRASVQATGTTGGIGGAQITAPLFELTASGTAQNYGSANLLAPSPKLGGQAQAWLIAPMGRLTAIGSAVVTATYEAYAVNLKHTPQPGVEPINEVTRYTNFPFTHVVRYKNSYYGVNDTGLYLLEGTTDETAPIPWAVKTAMDDFKSPMKKTIASAYFGGRFGPASTVQLHAGEQTPNTYSFTTPRDALAQNYRQVFGKGVKERFYALGASGIGTVELDNIELETHNMTRRI